MPGETNLTALLASMKPMLQEEAYVFCTRPGVDFTQWQTSPPQGFYREREGWTIILTQGQADARGLVYDGIFRCITLQVHSSLEAVGLTAAVSTALTEAGISANIVAAYHHDHIFVPVDRAVQALQCLQRLSRQHQSPGLPSQPGANPA